MPFSHLPFVVQEHLKNLTDISGPRMQNKNINTMALLIGIYNSGQYGCMGRELIKYFPVVVYNSVHYHSDRQEFLPGVAQVLKSKLISIEQLGLIETRPVEVSGHISDRFFLTDLGIELVRIATEVYSGWSDTSATRVSTLAQALVVSLMTQTTYIRGISKDGNIWYEMARKMDDIARGACLDMSEQKQQDFVLETLNCMANSRQFYIPEEILAEADKLNETGECV